jgi:hypothetical protein
MSSKKEVSYLIQVALPFGLLAWWKSPFFLIPVLIILLILPVPALRRMGITGWQKLGLLLGKIISPLVLSLIYYLAITPLALLRKLLGGDALQLKKPQQTTLRNVEGTITPERFDDLW